MAETSTNQTLVLLLILLPLFGFFIQAFLGGYLMKSYPDSGKKILGFLAVAVIVGAFACAIGLTMDCVHLDPLNRSQMVTIAPWINLGSLRLPFEFLVDPLSLTMCLIITGIGSLIHLYATGYMAEEKEYSRFFTYMNLFVFAMLILVLAGNLVLLFVGWEGVGLCSYLLVGFWYTDQANATAGNKAFIVNRVGDVGFMLGTFLLFWLLASDPHSPVTHGRYLSFDTLSQSLGTILAGHPALTTAIGLLFLLAACGKSAQFPLYFWLPDAMAGPTPVSALIHAATMVTAGVFLVNRLHIVYELSPIASAVMVMIGAFTALFAALIAFGQTDIKKVLAYSTISQLGYMFIACGAGGYADGIFHVATHAFFKALLFLGAGAVIASMAHNQDLRNYGRLSKYLPITCITMVIGFLAISGIPPLAGFYSKEAILRDAMGGSLANAGGFQFSQIAGIVGLLTAFLTAVYMARLTWLTFFGNEERWRAIEPIADHEVVLAPAFNLQAVDLEPRDDPFGWYFAPNEIVRKDDAHDHELDRNHEPKEVSLSMSFPLIVLAILSLVGGYVLQKIDLNTWLYPTGLRFVPQVQEVSWLMPAGIAAGVLGVIVGGLQYSKGLPKSEGWDLSKWNPLRLLARRQFGYNYMMTEGTSESGKDISNALNDGVELGLIEGGMSGFSTGLSGFGGLLVKLQSGYVRNYALLMFIGAILFLGVIAATYHGVIR